MSDFTVRIELHDANYNDYQTLHAAMERQGFTFESSHPMTVVPTAFRGLNIVAAEIYLVPECAISQRRRRILRGKETQFW